MFAWIAFRVARVDHFQGTAFAYIQKGYHGLIGIRLTANTLFMGRFITFR